MLFPYIFVRHSMDKMQEYIDYIFHQVWCTSSGKTYDTDVLFAGNVELNEIIKELELNDYKSADFFLTGIEIIFNDFQSLNSSHIDQLKLWYRSNNDIKHVCANSSGFAPAIYSDIDRISTDLSTHLKGFYKNLYSDFLLLKPIKSRIGDIDSHYFEFMTRNKKGKCPFCGINDLFGVFHTKREAYDHYLPKDKYPFNTINFYNLAPACHACNSSYKLSKNPLFESKSPISSDGDQYRKAFYPYRDSPYQIELNVSISAEDWSNIKPDDIKLELGPNSLRDEIDTWLDVYGIEERYTAKCSGENDGKYWISQVLDECLNSEKSPRDILNTLNRNAQNSPFAEANFLKHPFLRACDKNGLFSTDQSSLLTVIREKIWKMLQMINL